jgi:hypothetical protein
MERVARRDPSGIVELACYFTVVVAAEQASRSPSALPNRGARTLAAARRVKSAMPVPRRLGVDLLGPGVDGERSILMSFTY